MVDDDKVRYIQAASAHGLHTLSGTAEQTDSAYDEIMQSLRELRQTPDNGVEFLSSLLSCKDPSVVAWAASHLLAYREDQARIALQRVARSGVRLLAFGAEMTLREWNASRLKVD